MITVIDIGKYTLRTIGSEVVMETKYEPSERKSPFELITTMLYGPNADITKTSTKTNNCIQRKRSPRTKEDWILTTTTVDIGGRIEGVVTPFIE